MPAQAYVILPLAGFRYVTGELAVYRSSAWGERRFCATCGSQIEFRDRGEPATLSLNSGTLDDPALVPPDRHIWTSSEVAWFGEAGRLQRFREDS